MATVELSFSALPAHVRTARLLSAAVARRVGVDGALLDEVRLAVGEACTRAVGLHQRHDPQAMVEVSLGDDDDHFSVAVHDRGPSGADGADGTPDAVSLLDTDELGAALEQSDADAPGTEQGGTGQSGDEQLPTGFGLAVIAGLVDDFAVHADDDGHGTRVVMRWPRTGQAAGSTQVVSDAQED